jgi:hypothetical protein
MSPKTEMSSRLVPSLSVAVYVDGWGTAVPVFSQRDLRISGLCTAWRTSVDSLCQADHISTIFSHGDAIILGIKRLLSGYLEPEKPRTLKTTKGFVYKKM